MSSARRGVPRRAFLFRGETWLWIFVSAILTVFVAWPVGAVLIESFLHGRSFSLRAWERLATRDARLLIDSVALAACVALLVVALSVPLALRLVYGPARRRGLIVGALALSTISPPFLCPMAWLMLFGRRGLVTWRLLGIEWSPYGFHGALLMEALPLVGVASLLIAASLDRVDSALEEASLDLGASPVRTLSRVSLPLARHGIAATALLAFVRSLSDFGTPLFVGGRFQTLASRAYGVLIGVGDFPLACAMDVLLVLPALLILIMPASASRPLAQGMPRARSLSLPRWALAVPSAVAWAYVIVQVIVYGLIFIGSITDTWGASFALTGRHLAAISSFRGGSLVRSLACSIVAAVGGALLAAVLALLSMGARPGASRVVRSLVDAPHLMPGTFLGVGYLLASSRLPIDVPPELLIAAVCLFRQLSPSLRAAEAGLAQMDPALREAVRDLGGGPMRVLKDLVLPLLLPFLRLGALNAFGAAMTTTGPIIFLVSPYARVAAVELFESINEGAFGAACAMGSTLIAIVALVDVVAWRASRRLGISVR